ncbi:MAG: tetratricopeptide repeat protein [Deltaproteobacteria bacterium]
MSSSSTQAPAELRVGPGVLQRPAARDAPGQDPELEAWLREGEELYGQGKLEEAHARFQQAHRRRSADPRCLAWYGLTLILVEKNNNLGVRLCEEATRGEGTVQPLSWLSLSRAFLALGYRERAVRALQKGLTFEPNHPSLTDEMAKLGLRREPVIGFLSRSNPLNRLLGRMRNRIAGR